MKVKVWCSKYECRKDIYFETQLGPVPKNTTSNKGFRLGVKNCIFDVTKCNENWTG